MRAETLSYANVATDRGDRGGKNADIFGGGAYCRIVWGAGSGG